MRNGIVIMAVLAVSGGIMGDVMICYLPEILMVIQVNMVGGHHPHMQVEVVLHPRILMVLLWDPLDGIREDNHHTMMVMDRLVREIFVTVHCIVVIEMFQREVQWEIILMVIIIRRHIGKVVDRHTEIVTAHRLHDMTEAFRGKEMLDVDQIEMVQHEMVVAVLRDLDEMDTRVVITILIKTVLTIRTVVTREVTKIETETTIRKVHLHHEVARTKIETTDEGAFVCTFLSVGKLLLKYLFVPSLAMTSLRH